MKRLLTTIIAFLILNATTAGIAENAFNSKADELQQQYDSAYQDINEIVTGDELNYMVDSYDKANQIWIELAGVDFNLCFDKAFKELSDDVLDAYTVFDEYEGFEINEEG